MNTPISRGRKPAKKNRKLVTNFADLEDLAMYTPLRVAAFYRQEAPMEICHLLETYKIQKVQFVYREIGEQYEEDCENLMHVQRVLRGAYEYPDGESKHEKPGQFAHEISEWQKLPKKFNVRREEKEDYRDELWWASAKVLVENYSTDLLKGNGPRCVITLTRRKE
ncbi:hypothetical protein E6O75_ATG02117 [Venturia nashicola]|uniref:Uncharacterized protein n=1 Tax=Venturia nashicola TaxID=86259 RepID=A0A4Z1P2K1_9PEZI|nr:hypothetical protein E6O75_ATG02117 [Venturia nashicola]